MAIRNFSKDIFVGSESPGQVIIPIIKIAGQEEVELVENERTT